MSALLIAGISVITDHVSDLYKTSLDASADKANKDAKPSKIRVLPKAFLASLTFFLVYLERENFYMKEGLAPFLDNLMMTCVAIHLVYQCYHGLCDHLSYDQWSDK